MISDAHVHLDERMKYALVTDHIPAIISCATPEECEEAIELCKKYPFLIYACGIHPWLVETITWEMMYPYLRSAKIIGEIGMDSVWCDQNRGIQLDVFMKQLAYASKHKKPVVLHTKGEEKTIVKMLSQYPNTYLVHWYSCADYLDLYKELHCYFSVGPDVINNDNVKQVVKHIDLDHLLIESDGIAAIEWALGSIKDEDYQSVLYQTLTYIAKIKQLEIDVVSNQIQMNYMTFINAGGL